MWVVHPLYCNQPIVFHKVLTSAHSEKLMFSELTIARLAVAQNDGVELGN